MVVSDVLGATLYREYGETSAVCSFAGAWLLLVTGGSPTEDKPDVTFAPCRSSSRRSEGGRARRSERRRPR